ncbi:hypothetical protein C0Q70_00897 [Pomacea canaliculata]|uniref:Uncharacterized protein n=1 Tax=Pomacea canaliculata TaxID=400727 RepID=A0A2T7PXY2_POMCA|nr:hypothetical protein C0Q70_00897 [Pomacea canaliculata]
MSVELTTAQLQEKLCQMGNLSEDVSAQQLEKGNSLGDILLNSSNCQYKCQQQAQQHDEGDSGSLGTDCPTSPRITWLEMRDTRAICGISLDDVDQLPATAAIESWQAAFMEANCENLKAAQAIAEKYRLVLTYVTKTGITKTNVAQLGPQAIVNTDLTELRALDTDGKKTVVQLMGRQPLYDASADWNKQMLGYAYDAYLSVWQCQCRDQLYDCSGLRILAMLSELNQLQAADALGHFGCGANPGACPELSQSDLLTLQQVMVSKTNKLVEAVKDREESVDMREGQWKKSALSDADKQGLIDIVTCGLLKALDARARYRAQTPSSTPATRRKRSTDILILDTKSNVLTVQQINDLNTTDFDNCAETLGTATGWSLEQKAALIGKAKQAS